MAYTSTLTDSVATQTAQGVAEDIATFGQSLKSVGSTIVSTPNDISKAVGNEISDLPGNLSNISLAPGMSIKDFTSSLSNTPQSGLGGALEKITGLDVNNLIELPSKAKLKNMIVNGLGEVERQIQAELQACIEKHLLALLRKVPVLGMILNYEQIITNLIAQERIKLQRKIQSQLDRLAFQKIKIQQVALFKQKITEAIRGACPDASPGQIKKYKSDPMWVISRSKKVAQTTSKEIQEDAVNQAAGFNTKTSSSFKKESGEQEIPADVSGENLAEKSKLENSIVSWLDHRYKNYEYYNEGTLFRDDFSTGYVIYYNVNAYKGWSSDIWKKPGNKNLTITAFAVQQESLTNDSPRIEPVESNFTPEVFSKLKPKLEITAIAGQSNLRKQFERNEFSAVTNLASKSRRLKEIGADHYINKSPIYTDLVTISEPLIYPLVLGEEFLSLYTPSDKYDNASLI